MRRARVMLALALAAGCVPQPAGASGPFFPEPVFVRRHRPDSLEAFVSGRLGIVTPEFRTRYRILAWRWLSGRPLDPAERAGALRFLREREHEVQIPPGRGLHAWLAARARVPGLAPPGPIQNWLMVEGSWAGIPNCGDDAFRTAAATLDQRMSAWGASSAELKAWVEGQDSVFANCGGRAGLPPELAQGSEALRRDRDYQRAAARFYRLELAEARAGFEAIARDRESPWRTLAPYLAARARVREATLAPDSMAAARRAALDDAHARLGAILADPAQRPVHADARRLRDFVQSWRDPAGRLAELAERVAVPGSSADFRQDLLDLEWLYARRPDDAGALARSGRATPGVTLLRWLVVTGPGAAGEALAAWRPDPDDHARLVAAVLENPGDRGLRDAAERVAEGAPGSWTIVYALAAAGADSADTPARIERRLARPGLSRSDRNRLLALAARHARGPAGLARWLPREPAAMTYTYGEGGEFVPEPDGSDSAAFARFCDGPYLDEHGEYVVNRVLSAAQVASLARDPAMPHRLGLRLARVAWVRAALAGREATARAMADHLVARDPWLARDLRRWIAAPRGAARDFETAWTLLRNPGLSPWAVTGAGRMPPLDQFDVYHENLWCHVETGDVPAEPPDFGSGGRRFPSVHDPPDRAAPAEAREEIATIAAAQGSIEWLGPRVIGWARSHPGDARAPEALHRLVRLTRVGCYVPDPGPISRAAFELLHRRWPGSVWAKRTPYWYANR